MHNYPRISLIHREKNPPRKDCSLCKGKGAELDVTVQVDWFRGNDNTYHVHRACLDQNGSDEDSRLKTLGYNS